MPFDWTQAWMTVDECSIFANNDIKLLVFYLLLLVWTTELRNLSLKTFIHLTF